jgi:hypothetical protein
MEDLIHEPVELTESELEAVAGGNNHGFSINIGNGVYQSNGSVNVTSTGNNNNGLSGNQLVVFPIFV